MKTTSKGALRPAAGFACSDVIVGSKNRYSSWRRSLTCKCPLGWVVRGDASVCQQYVNQRYFPHTLQPDACECGKDSGLSGVLEILKEGPFLGKHAALSHFDFTTERYCVVSSAEPPEDFGCFKRKDLRQVNRTGGFVQSLDDMSRACSSVDRTIINIVKGYHKFKQRLGSMFSWRKDGNGTVGMTSTWADEFSVGFYVLTLTSIRGYKTRHAKNVKLPVRIGKAPEIGVGNVSTPLLDIDKTDGNSLSDKLAKNRIYIFDCILDALTKMPFEDSVNTDKRNTWQIVMKRGRYSRKKDWLLQYYEPYDQASGEPTWPPAENDLSALFLKGDIWDDKLESAMAFDLIGTHRIEVVQKTFQGEVLPYAIRLSSFANIDVRPGFSRFGADLFFTSAGLPALIVTPEGSEVSRGSKGWQYWKFVWRSTLVTMITLIDHLYVAHFQAGNILARTSRQCLPPDHPLRRLLTIFTFWTIPTNRKSMHTLLRSEHSLHRASPIKSFEDLSKSVPSALPTLLQQHQRFAEQASWEKMPGLLRNAAYFADGRLLYQALRSLVSDFARLFPDELCGTGAELASFRAELRIAGELLSPVAGGKEEPSDDCNLLQDWLVAALWSATGWHRHVGTVADFYGDPDLASSSWVDGEAFGRPKQHLILSVIASFTSTNQPKLNENYSRVFEGMLGEEKAIQMWQTFQEKLTDVQRVVHDRNAVRLIKNYHADPGVVESSVAV